VSSFDDDTALVPQEESGRFAGSVSENYWVQSGPNGGYLAALALRGAATAVPDPERAPRSLHVRYLTPPRAGPFELATEVIRRGRSMTAIGVRIQQNGRDFLHASASFSEPFSKIAFQDCAMPDVPPIEQCHPVEKRIAMNHQYDMLRALGGVERTGPRALSAGWIRFADPRPIDALALAALWDAWPPAVFARAFEQRFRGAVPTVEVSVYFRRRVPLPNAAPSDYVLLKVESTMAEDGVVEESGEIWSRDGLLLAQSRQLALLV
jgi:acyl-CoA thioesterase